jgi:hypothetical protein
MKLFGFGTVLAGCAGLAAGWTVAFADEVAREAFHGRHLDLASARGLGRAFFALAGGTATSPRARKRRGIVDTIVSNVVFFTLVRDGMRREHKRTRLVIAAGSVAALSIVPLLPPRRWLLGTGISFVAGGAAAIVATRLVADGDVSDARARSTDRSPRDDDPSRRAHLAA